MAALYTCEKYFKDPPCLSILKFKKLFKALQEFMKLLLAPVLQMVQMTFLGGLEAVHKLYS